MSMKHWMRSMVAVLALAALFAAPAVQAEEVAAKMGSATSAKDEMLFWIGDAESKLMELAEVTPEGKYSWSPSKGVRTTGEVFMHVAAANYGIPASWGVAPPEGFTFEGYEKSMTKKADIQNALKASFAHMKKSLQDADDATLMKQTNLFGMMDTSVRGAYMMILSHVHEHLGQSIAYARSNNITPPWTARQNEQMKQAQAKAKEKAEGKAMEASSEKKDEHAGHKH